ncbi:MAG: RNA-processing protein [Candidatus Aenigmarchaeota archaeon]|nr:RNA-processing protein [Candidatus Aenigmarchaeota archaeon]
MMKHLLIPHERKAVLIGTFGTTRRQIERETHTKITVDPETNDVLIGGESVDILVAETVIKAIGRGFAPHKALKLMDEAFTLAIIELSKDEKVLKRVRARIIGTKGKCRKRLEMLTETDISVFGKTVAIIGTFEKVFVAEQAVQKLIKGFTHKSVYAFLEQQHRVKEW